MIPFMSRSLRLLSKSRFSQALPLTSLDTDDTNISDFKSKQIEFLKTRLSKEEILLVEEMTHVYWQFNEMEHKYLAKKLEKSVCNIKIGSLSRCKNEELLLDSTLQNTEEYKEEKNRLKELLKQEGVLEILGLTVSGGQGGSMGEVGNEEQEEKEEVVVSKKTQFDVLVVAFDPKKKLNIIKDVKGILGVGLKECKDLIENLPATIQSKISEEDSQNLKDKLEAIGCTVEIQ